MGKKNSSITSSILAFSCFLGLIKLYQHVGFIYFKSVLWMNRLEQFDHQLIIYGLILLFSILVFINSNQLLQHKLNKTLIYFEFVAYLLALMFFLLFKSPGIKGINLDFSLFWIDLQYTTFEFVMNIVLFVPLGWFLAYKMRYLTVSIFSFVLILTVECLQFWLSLGVLDVIDILTNLIGVLCGILLSKLFSLHFNYKLKAEDSD
ncbi:MAG: VanZ family protein [Streptococcaceae bacterium]|jgi:glycopeptide antibiotics resistance protein|nr:VanZ family protein [Streptococcaceae bacterium]